MKNLILILSLTLVSAFAYADQDVLGGRLINKRGSVMELRCTIGYAEDCSEIGVFMGSNESDLILVNTIDAAELDINEINRDARRESARDVNGTYTGYGFIGTAIGVLSGNGVVLTLGVLVDVAKSPFVLATYLPHRLVHLITFNRIKRKVKFMLDPKKIGKTKRISERDLRALNQSMN